MSKDTEKQLEPLKRGISDIVLSRLEPVSEFELIRCLQKPPYELLSEQALQGNLNLFQSHFLVFHCLHVLRREWAEEGLGFLRIEPLSIGLEAMQSGGQQDAPETRELMSADPLASYYLDFSHFSATSEADVSSLLDGFWSGGLAAPLVEADERSQALIIMELEAMPASQGQLKREFRQRVHQVHPDKGGSHEQMQALQWAYQTLRKVLQHGVCS